MPAKELFTDRDKKFRLLFEDHPQPMCVYDPQTQRFLQVNSATSALYGYTPEEFRNMSLRDLEAGESAAAAVEVTVPAPAPPVAVWRHRTKSGKPIEVEAAVHEIRLGGRPVQLAVLLDITGRRHLEDQLRQAQKM